MFTRLRQDRVNPDDYCFSLNPVNESFAMIGKKIVQMDQPPRKRSAVGGRVIRVKW
jgi:hypothetical protein